MPIYAHASGRARVTLRATALVHHHLGQVPLDDHRLGPVVDQRHAAELERGAARRHAAEVLRLAHLLDDVRVVRDVGVGRPVVAAVALAEVRVVPAQARERASGTPGGSRGIGLTLAALSPSRPSPSL